MATGPDPSRWRELRNYALTQGLISRAADAYATLMQWGEQLGYPPTPIISGRRSASHNRELQRRWDAGNRAGLLVRPAERSEHLEGRAFDVAGVRWLAVLGRLAPYARLRWGGTFARKDPNHFDLED